MDYSNRVLDCCIFYGIKCNQIITYKFEIRIESDRNEKRFNICQNCDYNEDGPSATRVLANWPSNSDECPFFSAVERERASRLR